MSLHLSALCMARAASRWIDPAAALELARNVTMVAHLDAASGVPCDVAAVALEAIEHRARHFGLQCSDPAACGLAMSLAWQDSARTTSEMIEGSAPRFAGA